MILWELRGCVNATDQIQIGTSASHEMTVMNGYSTTVIK